MSNFQTFIDTYAIELDRAVREYPSDYAWGAGTVPVVVNRMAEALKRDSYNHAGRAMKATCKALGLKYTRKAINEYLRADGQLPVDAAVPTDIIVRNEGSIFLFNPRTAKAQAWLDEHCAADGEHQYFGSSLVVEHRYARDLAALAQRDGLKVE